MEGSWRALAAWVAATLAGFALILGASGCGGDDDDSRAESPAGVKTADPLRTFAPLVEVAADEPWRPMDARWFIERSVLGFAEDQGCDDRKIAVGHTLAEQRTDEFNWIYPSGLGDGSMGNYFRNPYDADCKIDFDKRFYTDQLTRPHDSGPRIEGIRPGEGYYLDLVDEARDGPAADVAVDAPVYAERTEEGDDQLRLTYWLLFGMHGEPGEPDAHEGDWERVDVLLRAVDGDRYEPLTVQTPSAVVGPAALGAGAGGELPEVSWNAARRVGDTHPVVTVAPATHTMAVVRHGERCSGCLGLRAWRSLAAGPEQPWYGFGGAWGQPGATDATTGPRGPYEEYSTIGDKLREPRG